MQQIRSSTKDLMEDSVMTVNKHSDEIIECLEFNEPDNLKGCGSLKITIHYFL